MKLIIDIPRKVNEHIRSGYGHGYFPQNKEDRNIIAKAIYDSTPIPDNATNGDMIKAMFGSDKVFSFVHYVHLMAKVGNWFNEGVVAEFDKDWWNEQYQKGGKE